MSAGLKRDDNGGAPDPLPEWADCDCFCIHDYAGTGAKPCGWRGSSREVQRDEVAGESRCPRCGCATLFYIPLGRFDAGRKG